MTLWLASALLVFLVAGLIALALLVRRKGKKAWIIAAIVILTVFLLAALAYILLAFIFLDAASKQPPDEPSGVSMPVPEISSESPLMAAPMPDGYDLPTDEVPALHPDVLRLRDASYESTPILGTQNEVTRFVLYNLLEERFEFELYLEKDFAVDEGTGHVILNRACETAMAYYLFSAYNEFDMYTEERSGEDKVYAKIKLIYTEPAYDLEARAEALEFVMKNPVPSGGFRDFESEKAYARKIHDFIAKKITYSPLGYNPEQMFGMKKYEAYQEAYNVLAETESSAVCAGYARAFALIAQYAGINAAWVFGNETETESHAWNIIYPCDGSEAVLVDVTWDDTEIGDSPEQKYVSTTYFYIPLSGEYQHTAAEYFDEFLQFVNYII